MTAAPTASWRPDQGAHGDAAPEDAASASVPHRTLAPDLLRKIDAYWRAANYLSVGRLYLRDNPLLRRPLSIADIKPLLLGHWGTATRRRGPSRRRST